jgi:hypothetical protein
MTQTLAPKQTELKTQLLQQLNSYESKYGKIKIKKFSTLRAAIRAKCVDCSGTAQEMMLCTVYECPLWGYRTENIQTAWWTKEPDTKRNKSTNQ